MGRGRGKRLDRQGRGGCSIGRLHILGKDRARLAIITGHPVGRSDGPGPSTWRSESAKVSDMVNNGVASLAERSVSSAERRGWCRTGRRLRRQARQLGGNSDSDSDEVKDRQNE